MTPPLPFPHTSERASIDQSAVARAVDEANNWSDHALRELSWRPGDRTSEAVLAGAEQRIDRALTAALDRIAPAVGADDEVRGHAEEVLREAGWPDDETRALALAQARRDWLGERLRAAARPFGVTDPLDELAADHAKLVERLRRAPDDTLPLDAQGRHDLDWSVGAALRVALEDRHGSVPEEDDRLRAAVLASLSAYDEGDRPDAVALRLARRWTSDDPPAVDLLMAGHLALFASLIADRTEQEPATVELWLFAPNPLPIGLAMRAAGEGAAAIGGALAMVAHAMARPIDRAVACSERLHALDPAAARALMEDAG